MPTIGAIVAVLQGDSILLTLRQDFPIWCLPGGTVEPGETVAETAMREVSEETGLEVRLTRLVGIYSRPQSMQGGGHEVLFTGEPVQGIIRPDGKESLKVEWFKMDCLPDQLAGLHRTLLMDVVSDSPAVARRMNVYPTLSRISRQELYTLRDQGNLDLRALLKELCAPLSEEDSKNEIY
jgi:ADP-ribose pyrophosphatase YjhB (NUDIX family)